MNLNNESMRVGRRLALVIVAGLIAMTSACSNSLYKVKPAGELPGLPSSAKTADAGGVALRVAPLLTDEESQHLFEVNLPLSGVLPLRIELNHETGAAPLEFKRVRFRLHDDAGHEFLLLTTKKAIAHILKANGVTLYNPNARAQFEKDFTAYAFNLTTPLPASERRQGFLFFRTAKKEAVASPSGLTLTVQGLPQPVEIKLN